MIKYCWDCKEAKDTKNFHKCSRSKDNLRSQCKICVKNYNKSKNARKAQKKYFSSEKGRNWVKSFEQSLKRKLYHKKYDQTQKAKEYHKQYRKTEKARLYDIEYRNSEIGRLNSNKRISKYRQTAKGKLKNYVANSRHRAAKLKATPQCITKHQLIFIEMFYQQAIYLTEVTGIKWHVDHIIPLQGKNVCGLHVPQNLRVITKKENESKGNRIL